MKKGVIIELRDQYTYVLCKDAKIKKIKREYYHEVGKTIDIPFMTKARIIPALMVTCLVVIAVSFNVLRAPSSVQALSYVSLSVNPGLVFKIDENQKVTAVSYTNKEGNEMTKKIDFVDQSLDDCVVLFIDYCFENNYFNQDKKIDINVISDHTNQIQSLEKQINDTIDNYLKTHQISLSVSLDQVSNTQEKDAKELGIPNSKLKLIDMILKYYPNLNKNDLANTSVDDLIDYLEDKGYDEDLLDHLEDELEKEESQSKKNITLQQAKNTALKKVNGTITKTKEDNDDYTIYIQKDHYLYEIEVNKTTGKIDEIEKEVIKSSKKITAEKAKEIALNRVNGKVKSVDYNDDNEYEVEIQKDDVEYEIIIDASSGKILEVEKDD